MLAVALLLVPIVKGQLPAICLLDSDPTEQAGQQYENRKAEAAIWMVGVTGIEPVTPTMST